jgi:hypothetical protein
MDACRTVRDRPLRAEAKAPMSGGQGQQAFEQQRQRQGRRRGTSARTTGASPPGRRDGIDAPPAPARNVLFGDRRINADQSTRGRNRLYLALIRLCFPRREPRVCVLKASRVQTRDPAAPDRKDHQHRLLSPVRSDPTE